MGKPIVTLSSERIPRHSALARPLIWIFIGILAMGTLGIPMLIFEQGARPLAGVVFLALVGLTIGGMRSLCQRVYMTREGIELTRPPRLVPWSLVGDAFRIPMTGPLTPVCCIAIRDPENWHLHFLGRADFERVVRAGRAQQRALRG